MTATYTANMIRVLMRGPYPLCRARMSALRCAERDGAAHDDARDRQQVVDRDALVGGVGEADPARPEQDARDPAVAVQAHVAAVADADERRRGAELVGRRGADERDPRVRQVRLARAELPARPGDLHG